MTKVVKALIAQPLMPSVDVQRNLPSTYGKEDKEYQGC
jgi:hypothetical protein